MVSLNGFSLLDSQNKPDFATFFLPLKDWKERTAPDLHPFAVREALQREVFQQIREAQVILFNPPPIPGMSSTGGFEFWIQNRGGDDPKVLQEAMQKLIAKGREKPELGPLTSTFNANSQQLFVDLDREKARSLNVPVNDVFDLIQGVFGSVYVNDFNKLGRTFRVLLQADASYRTRPEDISQVFVRSNTGQMIPLSALVTMRYQTGPDNVPRFNVFPAARINGNAGAGYSSGQALAAMEALARETLPETMSYAWTGQAYQEKQVEGASALAFVFGIVMGRLDQLALPGIPAGLPSELLARRPDLLGAEQELIAANTQIGVARAQYFPTISLTGLVGGASGDLSSLFSGAGRTWSHGGTVLGPIFTAGNIAGQVQSAEAVQQQALARYEKAIQTAFAEVETGLISTRKTREEQEAQVKQVTALSQYARLARLSYDIF